jgi:hypothetical protein
VFYDKYELVSLWGKNLFDHLQEVYYSNSRFVILFLSENYAKKIWTNHERVSAQAKAFQSHQEYILPARFDTTEIPGILPTIGYIDLNKFTPLEFAKLIKEKIGRIERYEFLPQKTDLVINLLEPETDKEVEEITILVEAFFESLQLMKNEERLLLYLAIANSCPTGLPNNIHLNIEYLSRLSNIPVKQIESIFARLDCLGYVSHISKKSRGKDICEEKNIIKIEYKPLLVSTEIENATFIMVAIVDIFSTYLCPECRKKAFERLDFSILSSLSGYPEIQN